MVLVDTSVWIKFIANRAPYATELDRLLSVDEVQGMSWSMGNFSSVTEEAAANC